MAETKLIQLHDEYHHDPIWINAANIESVQPVQDDRPYTHVKMMNKESHTVRETPQEIARLIEG